MRRERYVGDWLPEPLPDAVLGRPDAAADPADRVSLAESVTMAFLVVLDAMTPAERVAFILHDVFRYSFVGADQIARAWIELARRRDHGTTLRERSVNGTPGLVVDRGGATVTVFASRSSTTGSGTSG